MEKCRVADADRACDTRTWGQPASREALRVAPAFGIHMQAASNDGAVLPVFCHVSTLTVVLQFVLEDFTTSFPIFIELDTELLPYKLNYLCINTFL
jgi:hypothetical protein